MKRSKYFVKTYKEVPSDADSINAALLTRGGFVQKHMAGVYSLLPLGLRVYKKIEAIIREEMDGLGGQEIMMNVLQPKELWDETKRWDELKDIMYQMKDVRGAEIGMAPTHEEQVTDIVRKKISSYKELPVSLYQIQTKFRNEARAKSGLLRGREFIMKDMYSFHSTQDDFDSYYELAKKTYVKLFKRMAIDAKVVNASGGAFSKFSHELQAISPTGEDTIYYCNKCDFAENKEITTVKGGDDCPECGGKIIEDKSIEVGNIFPLKNKFSSAMGANFLDKDGNEVEMIMGCYGIGLTRALATIVELYNDSKGIIWPVSVAPFQVNLVSLGKNAECDKIYDELIQKGIEVLYDDREDVTAGEKFADADLIGCPVRLVVSDKSLQAGGIEFARRGSKDFDIVKEEEVVKLINESL